MFFKAVSFCLSHLLACQEFLYMRRGFGFFLLTLPSAGPAHRGPHLRASEPPDLRWLAATPSFLHTHPAPRGGAGQPLPPWPAVPHPPSHFPPSLRASLNNIPSANFQFADALVRGVKFPVKSFEVLFSLFCFFISRIWCLFQSAWSLYSLSLLYFQFLFLSLWYTLDILNPYSEPDHYNV